jgi:hypothetical protein
MVVRPPRPSLAFLSGVVATLNRLDSGSTQRRLAGRNRSEISGSVCVEPSGMRVGHDRGRKTGERRLRDLGPDTANGAVTSVAAP